MKPDPTFDLFDNVAIHRHVENWLSTEGADCKMGNELAHAVQSVWPSITKSDARYFADGLMCGLYLARVGQQ